MQYWRLNQDVVADAASSTLHRPWCADAAREGSDRSEYARGVVLGNHQAPRSCDRCRPTVAPAVAIGTVQASETNLDLRGVAEVTGLTVKAIRRRVERGSLPVTLVHGTRFVSFATLHDAGLLPRQPPASSTPCSRPLIGIQRRLLRLEARMESIERSLGKDH